MSTDSVTPLRFFHVSFYHRDTGLFNGIKLMSSDETAVKLNTPEDHLAIAGHHDHLSRRVDLESGQVVPYQPPSPSDHHMWEAATERWVLNDDRQLKIAAHRDALSKIAILEASQPRYIREHTLGTNPKALERLQAIEDEIVELRKSVIQELCAS
jgi:hypothetical protein